MNYVLKSKDLGSLYSKLHPWKHLCERAKQKLREKAGTRGKRQR